MQEKFQYDGNSLNALERSISIERLQAYLDLAEGDKGYAISLYEWNTKLSEALYSLIQGFEVTLRNAIHKTMTLEFQREDWFSVVPLEQEQRKQLRQASERILEDGNDVTPGRIIAELMFGFWTSLAGTDYAQTLWDRHLNKAFRTTRVSRKIVAKRLKKIRYLRNRVAHHESIIGKLGNERNLAKDAAEILEATGWICAITAKWIASNSTFDQHYQSRPVRPSGSLPFPEGNSIAAAE